MPQPSETQLLRAADAVLGKIAPGATVQTIRKAADAAYAAYAFSLVMKAAELVAVTGTIRLRTITQNPLPPGAPFMVRGAPGHIYSVVSNYGFGEFKYNSRFYEAHLGVQYFGSSRVLHEFDISIIEQGDADAARQNQLSPSSGKARVVFECKHYAGNIGIGLGREFVGLIADFSATKSARLVTNSTSASVRQYLIERVRLKLNAEIYPGSPGEAVFINAVADDLKSRLR